MKWIKLIPDEDLKVILHYLCCRRADWYRFEASNLVELLREEKRERHEASLQK